MRHLTALSNLLENLGFGDIILQFDDEFAVRHALELLDCVQWSHCGQGSCHDSGERKDSN